MDFCYSPLQSLSWTFKNVFEKTVGLDTVKLAASEQYKGAGIYCCGVQGSIICMERLCGEAYWCECLLGRLHKCFGNQKKDRGLFVLI